MWYVNGLAITPVGGVRAVTFRRSSVDEVYLADGYLHVRYTQPSPPLIASTAATAGFAFSVYDAGYPVREGYYWVRQRRTTINGMTIETRSLKDSAAIISFRFPPRYVFTTPVPPLTVYENEDYLLIVGLQGATVSDMVSALSSTQIYTLVSQSSPAYFTTAGFIPDWREHRTYTMEDEPILERRQLWDYELEFADYVRELVEAMKPLVAPFPMYHVSEYHRITDTQLGAILYMPTMQDKSILPIYQKIPPFDTHHFYMGKVDFLLMTNDFFAYRGFHNRFYLLDLITNRLPTIRARPSPAHLGYYAAVKWMRGELQPELQAKIEDVSSDKGYYQYQLSFSAELLYLAIRSKYRGADIEQVLVHLVEGVASPCQTARIWGPKLTYMLTGGSILPVSTETTPIEI